MASLRLFFLVTLLAAIVLAAPTPVQKKNVSKRSFKVPRSINRNHPRGLNGLDAMKKIASKYNMAPLKIAMKYDMGSLKDGFIAEKKSHDQSGSPTESSINAVNGTTTNGTGSVPANPEENAKLFLSPVTIGGQTFNLDFDSGSSDLWVFSTDLPQESIGNHAAFDASKSDTFQLVEGAQFEVSYGDGSGASGTVGLDTVEIGGVTVENQAVELANQVSGAFIEDLNTDGLVGLAFSKLNTVSDGTQRVPQKTFFDNVIPSLDEPVFTADLDPDGSGVYEFGTIDTSKFSGALTWVPVQASTGFWLFPSSQFTVGSQTHTNAAGSPAIADTGTSLLLVDQEVAEAYYAAVAGAEENPSVGGFIYPCDSELPDLSVAIGDEYMAVIPGDQITFTNVDDANTTCFGGVQGNQGAGLQIYGDTLFKSQFIVFNGGNQSLGFGEKPSLGRK